ncbi:MAG: pyridoxal phosphate-dependent aminotransferase [Brevibacterium sp.]
MLAISQSVARITAGSLRSGMAQPAPGCVSLAIGEPSFDTPEVIVEAQRRALAEGATHYAPQTGLPELRNAIASEVRVVNGWDIAEENVLVTHGGTAGLSSTINAIVSPGDRVLVEDPTYSLYADAIAMAGGHASPFVRDEAGEIDFDSLSKLASGARAIILCQPANPTGRILSAAEWDRLSDLAVENDLVVISDEAYEGLVYSEALFVSALDRPELRDRMIVSKTFSKKYAMTGWRLGYLVGAPSLIASAGVIHRTFNGAVNSANQWAGVAALCSAQGEAEAMRLEFEKRRTVMAEALSSLRSVAYAVPDGAFYFWVEFAPERGTSLEVAARSKGADVLVRPGQEFGASGLHALRLSFAAAPDAIILGMERLKLILDA